MKRIAIVGVVMMLAGCPTPGIQGDGVIKTEDRPITGFAKLEAAGGYNVTWSVGKPALSVSTDENLLPHVKTSVSGGVLRIDSDATLSPTRGITVAVSSSSLTDVRLDGGIKLAADDISGREFVIRCSGASDLHLSGSVDHLDASLTGAGHLMADSLKTQTAVLSLTGSSDAEVSASDILKVSITGAGNVTYSGNPKTVEQHVSGVGNIRAR